MNTIKLDKGNIILLLPFRLGPGWTSSTDTEIWIKTNEDAPKLDFLLDHVRDFFIENTENGLSDDSSCMIMKLKKDALPCKMFNNKTYLISNKAFDTHEKVKNFSKFPVSFDPSAFKINYLVRLFNRHDEAYFISQNDRPEERTRALQFITGKDPGLFGKTEEGNIEVKGWRMSHLINYLLYDVDVKFKIEFFDFHRFYPVTYVQPSEEIRDELIVQRALFYLRKVYNRDFAPAAEVLQRESEMFQPFRQIYYANSLEGAAVFNNCSTSDPEFVKTFYSNSFPKSLWLTILGIMQRSVFLQLMKEVSRIDPGDHQKVKEYLFRYTRISLKAVFSKVSVYHQHNDYYVMMISNFQINELQTELKDELYDLNNVLRQSHEDEVEKNNIIEKQSDRRLSIILFVLSIFGLIEVLYKVIEHREMGFFAHGLAFGLPLVLGIVSWILIFHRKKH
jgi:hypothetical protein